MPKNILLTTDKMPNVFTDKMCNDNQGKNKNYWPHLIFTLIKVIYSADGDSLFIYVMTYVVIYGGSGELLVLRFDHW